MVALGALSAQLRPRGGRSGQGDPFSATLACLGVLSARAAPDSITILALQRLRLSGVD